MAHDLAGESGPGARSGRRGQHEPRSPFDARRSARDEHGWTRWTSQYPGLASAGLVVDHAVLDFGVTRWRLGQMLGLPPGSSQVYQWGSRHRMSAFYLTRLVHLYHLYYRKTLDVQSFDGSTYWANYIPPEWTVPPPGGRAAT